LEYKIKWRKFAMEKIKRFLKDEEGIEMSEYALMGVIICVAVAVIVGSLSTAIQGALTDMIEAFG
jgi:Flp pilus assembly pilin Flp